MREMTAEQSDMLRRLFEAFEAGSFEGGDPAAQIMALARRVDRITREKEDLEHARRDLQARLDRIEHLFDRGVFNVEGATLKWLAKADEDKLKEIDAAVQFMRNAQFMGRWTWIGLSVLASAVGGGYALFNWLKTVKL